MGSSEVFMQTRQDLSNTNKYQAQFFPVSVDVVDAPINPNPPPCNTSSNSASQRALRSEALRFATFQGWPLDYIPARSLSSAGFFYRGIGDQTQCAFCYITISQWEPHDNPLTEHQRHAPNCPFILKLPVGNIPLSSGRTDGAPVSMAASGPLTPLPPIMRSGLDTCSRFQNEMRPNALPEHGPSSSLSIRPSDDEAVSFTATNLSSLSIRTHQQARNPTLVGLETRVNSFEGWPLGLAQKPLQLAEAGFFYMKSSDHVKCFCCDGALRNWEPKDDPWEEHARWFSRCNYLLSVKGEEYVKKILDKYQNQDSAALEDTEAKAVENAVEKSAEIEIPAKEVEETTPNNPNPDNNNLNEALLCKICYDQQMSMVFLPCGHSLSCPSCATALSNCPLCRKRINATVRAFFSFS